MDKENDGSDNYVTITLEPEDYWIPKEGETEEECMKRIQERLKQELGDEYGQRDDEVEELIKGFDEFMKNHS